MSKDSTLDESPSQEIDMGERLNRSVRSHKRFFVEVLSADAIVIVGAGKLFERFTPIRFSLLGWTIYGSLMILLSVISSWVAFQFSRRSD
jgi:hypothetical protein